MCKLEFDQLIQIYDKYERAQKLRERTKERTKERKKERNVFWIWIVEKWLQKKERKSQRDAQMTWEQPLKTVIMNITPDITW